MKISESGTQIVIESGSIFWYLVLGCAFIAFGFGLGTSVPEIWLRVSFFIAGAFFCFYAQSRRITVNKETKEIVLSLKRVLRQKVQNIKATDVDSLKETYIPGRFFKYTLVLKDGTEVLLGISTPTTLLPATTMKQVAQQLNIPFFDYDGW